MKHRELQVREIDERDGIEAEKPSLRCVSSVFFALMSLSYLTIWAFGIQTQLGKVKFFGWSKQLPHWGAAILAGVLAVAIGYKAPWTTWKFRLWDLFVITTITAIGLGLIALNRR
jgi:hypothetical protein